MKLRLPDVTLVAIETRDHALMRLAVEDCVHKVDFGDVLILTDRPLEFSPLTHLCSPRFHVVPDWSDKLGWCRAAWYDVPMQVKTSHMLMVQWDAGVWDVNMWRNEFLQYDFIGAPWWYPTQNVGNSGFGLKSTRLARYVYNNRYVYQCDTSAEDDLLCRKYRPQLEDRGFRWAPEKVAYDFAYEGCGPDAKPPTRHFGFHAAYNFRHVLDHDRLLERTRLMIASSYIRESYMMQNFVQSNPEIIKEIADEGNDSPLRAAE